MMMNEPRDESTRAKALVIGARSLVTSIGLSAEQTLAAINSGISCAKESSFLSSGRHPIKLSSIPNDCLEEIGDKCELSSSKTRYKRILRLLVSALDGLHSSLDDETQKSGPPIMLALPERYANFPFIALEPLLKDLYHLRPCFDLVNSQVFPDGRAAGILALAQARAIIASNQAERVIIAGADSYVDALLLSQLDADRRLLTRGTRQGFIPGEGAAAIELSVLNSEKVKGCIGGIGVGREPGHRGSEEVCLGVGLKTAINQAGEPLPSKAMLVCSGLTGEQEEVKEWRIAYGACDAIHREAELTHYAEFYGDLGAATLPCLLALTAQAYLAGEYTEPALIWASSDGPLRGALSLFPAN